jgi:hypothetical protein
MDQQTWGKKPVEIRRGAKTFSSLLSVHLGLVGIAVCCQRTTILKWARRGGVVWLLKGLCLSRARSENEYEQY